ncbi:MAG: hypothetical protein H6816_16350, partial [Phycisphaerales bacterium]|nr:hypothetical protein [Phycisphaerales bacterium]
MLNRLRQLAFPTAIGRTAPLAVLVASLSLVGCGGSNDDEGGESDTQSCEPSPAGQTVESAEMCGDNIDNDCDGFADCADIDCQSAAACVGGGGLENNNAAC